VKSTIVYFSVVLVTITLLSTYSCDQTNKYFKKGREGMLLVEHNFQYNNLSRKFTKVVLKIIKNNGIRNSITTYNIPKANHQYVLNVNRSELSEENDFVWLIYDRNVIHRLPAIPSFRCVDSLFFKGDKNINDVRVLSQEPRLKGGKKATHSIIVHNYNFTPVALKFLITYYSPKGNSISDTTIVSNVDIPPEGNQKIILQVMSEKLLRAKSSIVSIIEVDHLLQKPPSISRSQDSR